MQGFFSVFFSFLCGQRRCFEAAGIELPLCQRCLGLYLGALIAAIILFSFKVFRSGLPPKIVFFVQASALFLAMLGGIHAIDFGPEWRFLCGLWTGFVCAWWSVAGGFGLFASSGRETIAREWKVGYRVAAVILVFPALPVFAAAIPFAFFLGPILFSALAFAGAICLAGTVIFGLGAAARHLMDRRNRSSPDAR